MELKKREEIIKALERCLTLEYGIACKGCTLSYKDERRMDCLEILMRSSLALIKELTEEIKDLEADYDRVYEQAEADIHGNMADGGTSCHWCTDKTRADTVKKMQEKLSDTKFKFGSDYYIYANNVDVIAKELLEGKSDV